MKTFIYSISGQAGFTYDLVFAESIERAREIKGMKSDVYFETLKEVDTTKEGTLEVVDYDDPNYDE